MQAAPSAAACLQMELLGRAGFTVSVCCGPCGASRFAWTVQVLSLDGQEFDRPYAGAQFRARDRDCGGRNPPPRMGRMNANRDSWTAYATREGLIRDETAAGQIVPTGTISQVGTHSANKYGARRTQVDGIWFDSQKEAARYQELKLLQSIGLIDELELQPVFPLHVMEL